MDFINQLAEEYVTQFSSSESKELAEINQQTYATHPKAHMLSGKVQGLFLQFISTIHLHSKLLML